MPHGKRLINGTATTGLLTGVVAYHGANGRNGVYGPDDLKRISIATLGDKTYISLYVRIDRAGAPAGRIRSRFL
jgi:hypothetical protein